MTRVSTWSARSWPAGDSSRGHVVKFIAHQLYLLNNRTKWMQVNWFRSFICHGDADWPLQATIIGEMFESREMQVPAGDERATKWHFIRGKNQRKVKKTKAISCGHWLKLQVDVPLFFKLGINAIPFGRLPSPWPPVVWPSVATLGHFGLLKTLNRSGCFWTANPMTFQTLVK